jgi:hypothetical protein
VYGFKERSRTPADISAPAPVAIVQDSIAVAQDTSDQNLLTSPAMPASIGSVQSGTQAPSKERRPLPAPQANAMAAVLSSVFGSGQAPWFLYGMGIIVALLVNMLGINPLAFALGMYLPIELNSPIMVGALIGLWVQKSSKDDKVAKARHDKGILIASGLIAGGALIGVLDALLKFIQDKYQLSFIPDFNNVGSFGNWLGLILFILLTIFLYWDATRAKPEKE